MIDIINEIYAGDEPAFNDQWDFYIVDTGSTSSIQKIGGAVGNLSDKILGSFGLNSGGVNMFSIPNTNIESMTIPTDIPNFEYEDSKLFLQVASSIKLTKDISMVVRETKFFRIYRYFQIWAKSMYDNNKFGYKSGYRNKTKLGILVFNINLPKNNNIEFAPAKVVIFENMRFKSMDDTISLDHTDGNPIKYTINLTCDKVRHI